MTVVDDPMQGRLRPGVAAALFVLLAYALSWSWWVPMAVQGQLVDDGFARFDGLPAVGLVGVAALLILVNGFGEETGWRGYLQTHLEKRRPLKLGAAALLLLNRQVAPSTCT